MGPGRELVTSSDVAIEAIGVAQLDLVDWLELKICSSTLFFGTSGRRCSRSPGRLARIKNLFIYTFFWHERLALQSVAVQAVNLGNDVSGHYFHHYFFFPVFFFS